jgi:hypothetical protein
MYFTNKKQTTLRGDIIATVLQFPVNLVIPLISAEQCQYVESLLVQALWPESPNKGSEVSIMSKAYYQNPDELQRARLLINGEEVKRGTVEQMKEAFKLQVSINQKANIAVQEWQKKPLSGQPASFVTISSRAVRTL